jgi:GDPmannose 4,6-dehydratase
VRAVITGVAGQDGTLLARALRAAGWEVLGLVRSRTRVEAANPAEIRVVDLCDRETVRALIEQFQPQCVYHLAACHQSSEDAPDAVTDAEMIATNFTAAEILADALLRVAPRCRLLLAGTSQMYTASEFDTVVDESTPIAPRSFYGRTKAWAREMLAHYRDHRGLFGGTAILFNHESPLRPERFVTRKISLAAARAKLGLPGTLEIQNAAARVDWSAAQDVVDGMVRMLAAERPADYVFASGEAHTVQSAIEIAFDVVGEDWHEHTALTATPATNDRQRPALVGNPARARRELGWQSSMGLAEMLEEMVTADVARLGQSVAC